jgi:translocator protein
MKLVYSIAIPLFVGLCAALFTAQGIHGWYLQIARPSFTPPNWIFGPVWSLLYILMGVSLYLIWKEPVGKPFRRTSLVLFSLQLTFNFLWSIFFFFGHHPGIALIDMAALYVSIVAMIVICIQVRVSAGLLQVPYIFWVSFAAVLNYAIWQLNA